MLRRGVVWQPSEGLLRLRLESQLQIKRVEEEVKEDGRDGGEIRE